MVSNPHFSPTKFWLYLFFRITITFLSSILFNIFSYVEYEAAIRLASTSKKSQRVASSVMLLFSCTFVDFISFIAFSLLQRLHKNQKFSSKLTKIEMIKSEKICYSETITHYIANIFKIIKAFFYMFQVRILL